MRFAFAVHKEEKTGLRMMSQMEKRESGDERVEGMDMEHPARQSDGDGEFEANIPESIRPDQPDSLYQIPAVLVEAILAATA